MGFYQQQFPSQPQQMFPVPQQQQQQQQSTWQKLQNSIPEQPSNAPFPTIHAPPIAPNTPANTLNTNPYGILMEPLQPPATFTPSQPAQQPTISPPKRTSSRFNSQLKSPVVKSPSKSPKNQKANSQIVTPPPPAPKQRNRSSRGGNSGGRGRGRGRGRPTTVALPPQFDYAGVGEFKSIHNNLRGTVYDLDCDEDFGNNGENLDYKSLRDRDRRRSFDSRGLINSTHTTPERKDIQRVLPVLPGPVDMRTYNAGSFDAQHSTTSQDAYNNTSLLGGFDTGTTDQSLHDIDEEAEKNFQSALKASQVSVSSIPVVSMSTTTTLSATTAPSTRPTSPPKVPTPDVVMSAEGQVSISSEEVSIDSDTINTMNQTVTAKASLSDSGNQLKLKIKGPLAYPDNYTISSYNSTSVTTVSSATSVTQVQTTNATNAGQRRMRKKELLEKYWYSDMNNEDSVGLPPVDNQKPTEANGTTEKRVSIPKAVDSMILLPSKDDELPPPNKRKKAEGKQGSDSGKRRTSICSVESADNNKMSAVGRRSNRTRNKDSGGSEADTIENPDKPAEGALKLTIRNNSVEKRIVSCPPKKRHVNIADYPSTSMEQYKNNCMKFRQMVMADFEEKDHKVKKVKEKKSKKHKKEKKEKKKIEISSGEGLKLCLRIGRPAEETSTGPSASEDPTPAPLKLKFSRKTTGGGYALDKSTDLGESGQEGAKDCEEAR